MQTVETGYLIPVIQSSIWITSVLAVELKLP